jgi:hypothetical protein
MRELGRGRVGGLFSLAGPSGGLTGAVLGGRPGQHFGLLAGFRLLMVVYALQLLSYLRGSREDVLMARADPESAE